MRGSGPKTELDSNGILYFLGTKGLTLPPLRATITPLIRLL